MIYTNKLGIAIIEFFYIIWVKHQALRDFWIEFWEKLR